MFWLLVIGIVLLALVFIVAEILIFPGGIVGIIGGLLLFYGIYLPYAEGYVLGGHINLLAIIIVLALSIYYAVRTKTWRKMRLSKNIDSRAKEDMTTLVKVGDIGVSISRLTPIGKARFGNEYYEVNSKTGFVDQNVEIEIVNIEKDKIIIKPKN